MGLDTVELLMDIEDEFQISIPDNVIETLNTPRDTIAAITTLLQAKLDAGQPVSPDYLQEGLPDPDLIWPALRRLIAEHSALPTDQISLDAHYVRDIGLD